MQRTESVFDKACDEITQNLLLINEPTRQKVKNEIKKICAKYSLERIPRNHEILAKVKEMVAGQLGKSEDEITPESSFIEDLGADSLDLVELIMSMEDEFGLEISDEDAESIITVQDAINFIAERKK